VTKVVFRHALQLTHFDIRKSVGIVARALLFGLFRDEDKGDVALKTILGNVKS
jgi:hypothetical protein